METAAPQSSTGIDSARRSAAQAGTASTPDKAGAISSDFDTFLKMLTAQIQNQDPLNPMDSSDYAVQLATFSSVEQQVMTNDLLRGMGAGGGGLSGLSELSGWVGLEARHSGPVQFTGEPVSLGLSLPEDATATELVVSTLDGVTLHRQTIAAGATQHDWQGLSNTGDPLLHGAYAVETVSMTESGDTERRPVSSYAEVIEVRSDPEGAQVVLEGGHLMLAEQIGALRRSGI